MTSGSTASAIQPPNGAEAPQPLAFQEVTNDAFGEQSASFEVQPTEGGVILHGRCPRCADVMEFVHLERIYRGLGRRRRPRESSNVINVACTCSCEHPGRPAGEVGCGAYWNIVIEDDEP